jgi:rod shape determining protein RodA
MSDLFYGEWTRHVSLRQKINLIEWPLVVLIAIVACIGFAMLFSAAGGHLSPWANRQMFRFCAGLAILVTVACIDLRVWMGLAYPAYAISLLLLIAVQVAGHVGLGAQRWIALGPLELQPSELMKIALVLALARYLHGLRDGEISHPFRLFTSLLLIAAPVALVLAQPNLGTAALLVMCGALMLFLAGLSWWWIVPTVISVLIAVPMVWQFALHDYQKQRVMTFLDPGSDALGAGWNITQAKIALGSGGLIGKGFLNGTQSRLNFLPEKETDFIFTMVGEEFGFIGSIVLLMMFAAVLFYGMQIALRSRSQFGRLLAMGIAINFFLYIMINALMVMGLIPVVGIPMPLLSYGGSAMMTVMFGFGLLMSVHVHRSVVVPRSSSGMI